MTSAATTPEQYLAELPAERRQAVEALRQTVLRHLPPGFEETMAYGMLAYVVPHSLYPAGYHCDPKQPLPFVSIASQKKSINLYHMGIYALPELLQWFQQEYPKHSKAKLDMGKSCIRFKKTEQIPHELLAELMRKVSPEEWIRTYETRFRRK